MSELRWDPLKMSWVIITTDRGRRPRDFFLDRETVTMTACPFCYGREDKTTREIFAIRPPGSAPDTPGWRVRVIPNKYPALRIEGELDKRAVGLYEVMNGIGAHEIVIETPDHERTLADLAPAEIADVFRAWRARLLDLRRDNRFRYIFIFKNYGIEAGAGIPHSHSQLIALPVTPPTAATELSVCRTHFEQKERCLICDLLQQEVEDGRRIIRDTGDFVVFTPYAARFPFELRILPRRHSHDFGLLSDHELGALAEVVKDTLLRLRAVLRDPPYNFILHSAPPMHLRLGKPGYWSSLPYDYHWHIELIPRLAKIAGFEWGTGFYMNPTAPEEAAQFLREADLSESL
jgi:UDPglucose--hexose-1-phosphate uridylyltransferase